MLCLPHRPSTSEAELQTTSNERVIGRHGGARPELKPGQHVTWAEVITSGRPVRPPRQGSLFPHRRSPDRQRSLERRRRLAASGPMPPMLAAKFTTGRLSTMRIVGDEVRRKGRCTACVDEIAARAGVCRRLAQAALREAEDLGLVHIQERRLTGTRNDSNVVTIISMEWLAWLRIGRREDAKNFRARAVSDSKHEPRRGEGPQKESSGIGFARSVPHSPP
jgi:hypothetical protein